MVTPINSRGTGGRMPNPTDGVHREMADPGGRIFCPPYDPGVVTEGSATRRGMGKLVVAGAVGE